MARSRVYVAARRFVDHMPFLLLATIPIYSTSKKGDYADIVNFSGTGKSRMVENVFRSALGSLKG